MKEQREFYKFSINFKKYVLKKIHFQKMKENNLELKQVKNRIKAGWELEQAVDAPLKVKRSEYEEYKFRKDEEERLKNIKRKYAKPKPWLEKYPQSVEGGEWFEHLSENDIFPKRKVGV